MVCYNIIDMVCYNVVEYGMLQLPEYLQGSCLHHSQGRD